MPRPSGRRKRWLVAALTVLTLLAQGALAMSLQSEEKAQMRQWVQERFEGPVPGGTHSRPSDPPFSFRYDGQPSSECLKGWRFEREIRTLDHDRVQRRLTYSDPATGMILRCDAVEYRDFPTTEWTVYLKNGGKADTPIVSDFLGLDAALKDESSGDFLLHYNTGSPCSATDYEPHQAVLEPGKEWTVATSGGRSSDAHLPYFDAETPGGGVLMAVGWPGQWSARFAREGESLRMRAGQEKTHFLLHPGEEVRSPLIVLQFWKGDRTEAHNLWRRFMLEHNLPRPRNEAVPPDFAACSSHQYGEMIGANEANQKMFIDRYLAEGLKLDYWWMDAGWYPNKSGWPNTGTWEVDKTRFPRGLRAISDHAHEKGVGTIVWFEPERVTPGTWLYENHPEWLLGPKGEQKLLDLGNPAARTWLTDRIDTLIREQGIDLYRQDFNIEPLGIWRANDSENRQGITENHYVTGFLAFWDELRRRHPNMLIDTCASGGRRNDIETLRRSVPLLRSDFILDPVAQQNHTYGIASWIPFYGTGVKSGDPYVFRSQMCPHITGCFDVRDASLDYDAIRQRIREWREAGAFMLADFYPMTPYASGATSRMAWQFNDPKRGEGMVEAFRRPECDESALTVKLHGLQEGTRYVLTNADSGEKFERTGRELMETGLNLALNEKPSSALLFYRKK
jgi:alpha-galactosidase